MIFSFIFFYVMGAFIFFCHTSIIIIKSAKKISSYMNLEEKEYEHLAISYLAKVIFQIVMMSGFPLFFGFYILFNDHFCKSLFVSSGLFTVIWLMITGVLIKLIYYIIINKIAALKCLCFDKYFKNKELFWTMCPILYGILLSFYDSKVFFTILAIVLGKYIWMDTFQIVSFLNIKIKVKGFLKKSQSSIVLLLNQIVLMGYLLARWYPVKESSIIRPNYTANTLLILTFFLMPILDLFTYGSMKLYARFITK